MLGDFTVKTQNSEGKSFFNLKSIRQKTKYGMRKIITVICVTYVQKDFWIRTLIKQFWTKYQFFTKLPQISHIRKNHNFSSIIEPF